MHPATALLEGACRKKSWSTRAAALLATGALASGLLLGAAVIDYWLLLPWPIRALAAMAILALLAGGAGRLTRLLLKRPALKDAALDLERERPGAGCVVSTAAEYLTGERKITQAYEPELAAALQRQAAGYLEAWPVRYWRRVRGPAVAVALAGLALLVFLASSTGAFTALKRVVLPWTRTTYTTVRVDPGAAEIAQGKGLAVRAAFEGRSPATAALHWRGTGEKVWHREKLSLAAGNDTSGFEFKELKNSLEYYVTGGDACSPTYAVQVYVPPAVQRLKVRSELPAYTGRAAQESESPDVAVLRASTVRFSIEPTVPLSRARLRFTRNPPVELHSGPDGWGATLAVTNDDEYRIELFDQRGRLGSNERPFCIHALPDEPPKLELAEPGQDIRADATQTVPVKIAATDDYGLTEVRLVYHKLGQPPRTLRLKLPPGYLLETNFSVELPLADLALKDYELVAYHAEAVDNNSLDGPGVGKSPVYFIEITNEEGKPCHSQCNCAKVNLLVIQKQIIADTTALSNNAAVPQFHDLAEREKEAADFGRIYVNGLTQAGAPSEAVHEMSLALRDLVNAQDHLAGCRRVAALPCEESALARFYQVIKMMPQLEDLPTRPPQGGGGNQNQAPALQVVLQAIKKQMKEEPDNRELADVLRQVQQLSRNQANLAQSCQSLNAASNAAPAESRPAGEAKPNPEAASLANHQDRLRGEAAVLAALLARLAGHDQRLGHNVPKSMASTAQRLSSASDAFREGNMRFGYSYALQGWQGLNAVAALLERILNENSALPDVSAEQAPREFEPVIDEYFKQLTRQE